MKIGDTVKIIRIPNREGMSCEGDLTKSDIGKIATITNYDDIDGIYLLNDNQWRANFTKKDLKLIKMKFKVGDIVTGTIPGQWMYNEKREITEIKETGYIVEDDSIYVEWQDDELKLVKGGSKRKSFTEVRKMNKKEMQEEIERLKEENEEQQEEINDLTDKVDELEDRVDDLEDEESEPCEEIEWYKDSDKCEWYDNFCNSWNRDGCANENNLIEKFGNYAYIESDHGTKFLVRKKD